jgi:hypothetical protein
MQCILINRKKKQKHEKEVIVITEGERGSSCSCCSDHHDRGKRRCDGMRGEEEDEKDGVCVSLFMIQCGIGPSKSVCRPGMCSED